jgi:mediator of RNA polymerase II transcription subunit 14
LLTIPLRTSRDNNSQQIATHAALPLSPSPPDLNDSYFSTLTLFTSAMISRLTDLKALHSRHIKHMAVDCGSTSLPSNMKFPAVFIRLSDVLKPRQSPESRQVATWAADFVQIKFKELEKPPSKARQVGSAQQENSGATEQERLITVAEARFKVVDRSKFSLLKGNVERDVAYNPELGVFALRLKAEMGTTILDVLGQRVQAIERLVDCVDAIRRSSADIQCETIALAKVVFTYSDAIGRAEGRSAAANIRRWKATLDLRNDQVKMSLEKGNPHLRALDWFNLMLNSGLGFARAPQYLAFTLPVFNVMDAIEALWQDTKLNDQGQVEVFLAALDRLTIRYSLFRSNKNRPRQLTLQMQLRERRSKPYWVIRRRETGPVTNPDDEFRAALGSVWRAKDRVWTSFLESASAEANDNTALLLKALDEAIRQLALKPLSPSVQIPTPARVQPPQGRNQQNAKNGMMQRTSSSSANKARPQQSQQGSNSNNVVVLDD